LAFDSGANGADQNDELAFSAAPSCLIYPIQGAAPTRLSACILDAAYPLYNDDLIRSAANLMGISRIGSAVSALFQNGITLAEKSGRIQNADNGNWILKG
jgi:hypothetical protein